MGSEFILVSHWTGFEPEFVKLMGKKIYIRYLRRDGYSLSTFLGLLGVLVNRF